MPSTPSGSLRIELQAAGENLNTWGAPRLNTALSMIEAGGHGLTEHTLTANKSLTYTNYTLTDGTDYVQKITNASDGGYTLTLGGFERSYVIWNDSAYDQTIDSSGGGASVIIGVGEVAFVYCDGTNVVRGNKNDITGDLTVTGTGSFGGQLDMNSNKIVNLAAPTSNADAVTKQYADGLAFGSSSLPGITPDTEFATVASDGSAASWQQTVLPEVITANETAVARLQPYLCVMSGGAFTLTLPASPSANDIVRFMTDENAAQNNLTIGRNGETIGGVAEDMIVNLNGFSGLLVYTSSDWKVVAL